MKLVQLLDMMPIEGPLTHSLSLTTLPVRIAHRKKWVLIGIFKPAEPHSPWNARSSLPRPFCMSNCPSATFVIWMKMHKHIIKLFYCRYKNEVSCPWSSSQSLSAFTCIMMRIGPATYRCGISQKRTGGVVLSRPQNCHKSRVLKMR